MSDLNEVTEAWTDGFYQRQIEEANKRILAADNKLVMTTSIRKILRHIDNALFALESESPYQEMLEELTTAQEQLDFIVEKARDLNGDHSSNRNND